jgi:hypothetical protein
VSLVETTGSVRFNCVTRLAVLSCRGLLAGRPGYYGPCLGLCAPQFEWALTIIAAIFIAVILCSFPCIDCFGYGSLASDLSMLSTRVSLFGLPPVERANALIQLFMQPVLK